VSATSRAGVAYVRNFDSFLFRMVERLYDAHTRRVEMRLAPTKRID
jgi:hypothetical protein